MVLSRRSPDLCVETQAHVARRAGATHHSDREQWSLFGAQKTLPLALAVRSRAERESREHRRIEDRPSMAAKLMSIGAQNAERRPVSVEHRFHIAALKIAKGMDE